MVGGWPDLPEEGSRSVVPCSSFYNDVQSSRTSPHMVIRRDE